MGEIDTCGRDGVDKGKAFFSKLRGEEKIQRDFEKDTEGMLDLVPSQGRCSSWTRGHNLARVGGDGPPCQ